MAKKIKKQRVCAIENKPVANQSGPQLKQLLQQIKTGQSQKGGQNKKNNTHTHAHKRERGRGSLVG